jgi:hypothetical protein
MHLRSSLRRLPCVLIPLLLGLAPANGLAKSALPGDVRAHENRHPAPAPKSSPAPKSPPKSMLPGDMRARDNKAAAKAQAEANAAAARETRHFQAQMKQARQAETRHQAAARRQAELFGVEDRRLREQARQARREQEQARREAARANAEANAREDRRLREQARQARREQEQARREAARPQGTSGSKAPSKPMPPRDASSTWQNVGPEAITGGPATIGPWISTPSGSSRSHVYQSQQVAFREQKQRRLTSTGWEYRTKYLVQTFTRACSPSPFGGCGAVIVAGTPTGKFKWVFHNPRNVGFLQ